MLSFGLLVMLIPTLLLVPFPASATHFNNSLVATADSIVTNGSYETPDVTAYTFDSYNTGQTFGGWTVESGSVDHISERYWQAGDGRQSLDLNACSAGTITMDLLTTPLQTYALQFSLSGNPEGAPAVKRMEVWWGTELVDTVVFDTTGHSKWQMGWFFHQYPVTATTAITRLKFKSLISGCYGPVLDAIAVKPLSYRLPSLDLPFDYTDRKFANVAVGINGSTGGRVTSWFDHTAPLHGDSNEIVTLWTGIPRIDRADVDCTFGYNCYDGHNGIDFQRDASLGNKDTPVYAAAAGTVREINRNWKAPNNICGLRAGKKICAYGNFVLIDHGGGYATFYAHLDRVDNAVQLNKPIGRQTIGYMGGTGGYEVHLHFGVYYDPDGIWPETSVVDPYGWFGNAADPWPKTSIYLWKYPLFDQATAYTNGAVLTSPSGFGKLTVSPGSFTVAKNLEIWDAIFPHRTKSNQALVGHPLWVRVFSTTNELPRVKALVDEEEILPGLATINIRYGSADLSHINLNQLSIYHFDKTTGAWTALPTTLDTNLKEANAQTADAGYFTLQAPFTCATIGEPNDGNNEAVFLTPNSTALSETFDSSTDQDWYAFPAIAGGDYQIQSTNWINGSQTSLELYDIDGETLVKKSDDILGADGISIIHWRAGQTGIYFVRSVRPTSGSYGCNATYDISISQSLTTFIPLLRR
jgi:choice-of-anchor C domain-containing protein